MNSVIAIAGCLAAAIATAGMAVETINYSYDARGRIKQVARNGAPNSGATTAYQFDRAHSRTRVTTSGVSGGGGGSCSFTINDPYAGGYRAEPLDFVITKSGSCSGTVVINYVTADGTAYAGSHYSSASGQVSFATADTTRTVQVSTAPSYGSVYEGYMYLNLSVASGPGTLSDAQGQGTIYDNS